MRGGGVGGVVGDNRGGVGKVGVGIPSYRPSKCAGGIGRRSRVREREREKGTEGLCFYGKKRSRGHKARPAHRHGWGGGAEGGRPRASSRDIV